MLARSIPSPLPDMTPIGACINAAVVVACSTARCAFVAAQDSGAEPPKRLDLCVTSVCWRRRSSRGGQGPRREARLRRTSCTSSTICTRSKASCYLLLFWKQTRHQRTTDGAVSTCAHASTSRTAVALVIERGHGIVAAAACAVRSSRCRHKCRSGNEEGPGWGADATGWHWWCRRGGLEQPRCGAARHMILHHHGCRVLRSETGQQASALIATLAPASMVWRQHPRP